MNKLKFLVVVLGFHFMLVSCSQTPKVDVTGDKVRRYGMVTGLKPEKVTHYKKLHAAVWPGVLRKITECNISNYSIYLKEIDGKPYLFSYWEYTGADFAADMKKMAADTTTQRWWKETAPMQDALPDAAAKGETWSRMEEVFHEN
jgi:L-rhamnose mutarotase